MNIFTTRIANDEERRRISSRSPIDVFVPIPEDTQYVSDFTGDYWPYRALNVEDALSDTTTAERTVNRSLKFNLFDSRPQGSNDMCELYDIADEINANSVFPIAYQSESIGPIEKSIREYQNHNFSRPPTLGLPISEPYKVAIESIEENIYTTYQTGCLRSTEHQTDFVIRGISQHSFDWPSVKAIIENIQEATSGDSNIHLHQPAITGDLIRYIRNHPGVINSIILPNDIETIYSPTIDDGDDLSKTLSQRGRKYLRGNICPHVRVASELSLLSSTFLDIETEAEFKHLIDESVIPNGTYRTHSVSESENSPTESTQISQH